MREIRATLIQSISELQAVLHPHLMVALEQTDQPGLVYQAPYERAQLYEQAFEWILAEELELIYGLFDERHQYNRHNPVLGTIYQLVREAVEIPLSTLVSHLVSAPIVYDNNIVQLRVLAMDLYIVYSRDPYYLPGIRNYSAITRTPR